MNAGPASTSGRRIDVVVIMVVASGLLLVVAALLAAWMWAGFGKGPGTFIAGEPRVEFVIRVDVRFPGTG